MARIDKGALTRIEIIGEATKQFLENGYSNTTVSSIAKVLEMSPGNLTFHYPTKEHLLAELTTRLCDYHAIVMESEMDEGRTSLLAYLLEITSMMSICDENDIAKDLYASVYRNPLTLRMIREADTEKVKYIFKDHCPHWENEDFVLTENVVSGIEYASIMKENAESIALDRRIVKTLRMVMKAYNVPEDLIEQKIEKVLAIDYRKIGRKFVEGFSQYVSEMNERALEEAHQARRRKKK